MIPCYSSTANYPLINKAIQQAMAELYLPAPLPHNCAILCGSHISPIMVAEHLGSLAAADVKVFHGGVDTYDESGDAIYLPFDQQKQQAVVVSPVRQWLDGADGCLITHNTLFGGMEAVTVIFITRRPDDSGIRSGMLRGVARLVLIADNGMAGFDVKKIEKHFNVIEM